MSTTLAKLQTTVAFFASVIKSGESWSPTCQLHFDDAMSVTKEKPAIDWNLTEEVIVDERDDEGRPKAIRFKPCGHIYQFEFSRSSSCGRARGGSHISFHEQPGGVMTKEQMIALRDLLNLSINEAVS